MMVGGCIASQVEWEKFNIKWTRLLARAGVQAFHAKDFYAFEGEFKWFKENGERDWSCHNKFRDKLADIIVHHIDEAISFHINGLDKRKRC